MIIRQNLAPLRADAIAKVNYAIDALRKRFITDITGQQMIYPAKEEEARRYLETEPEDLSEFFFLPQEIGVTAPTAYELAQVWLNMAAELKRVAGPMEKARMTASTRIDAATSKVEIEGALAAFFEQITP